MPPAARVATAPLAPLSGGNNSPQTPLGPKEKVPHPAYAVCGTFSLGSAVALCHSMRLLYI